MKQLTEKEIRAAFVNCTKGEAKRLSVPRDLADHPWDDLDYFGWRDPQAPGRAYLVAELEGTVRALVLRSPGHTSGQARRSMCQICLTTHDGGVSLMVAPKAGKAGQQGNSVGIYLCSDLACSLYVRGKRDMRRRCPAPRDDHSGGEDPADRGEPRRVRRQGDGGLTGGRPRQAMRLRPEGAAVRLRADADGAVQVLAQRGPGAETGPVRDDVDRPVGGLQEVTCEVDALPGEPLARRGRRPRPGSGG